MGRHCIVNNDQCDYYHGLVRCTECGQHFCANHAGIYFYEIERYQNKDNFMCPACDDARENELYRLEELRKEVLREAETVIDLGILCDDVAWSREEGWVVFGYEGDFYLWEDISNDGRLQGKLFVKISLKEYDDMWAKAADYPHIEAMWDLVYWIGDRGLDDIMRNKELTPYVLNDELVVRGFVDDERFYIKVKIDGEFVPTKGWYPTDHVGGTPLNEYLAQKALEEMGDLVVESSEDELVLDEAWRQFAPGTSVEDVWHYIEEAYEVSVGKMMYGGG